MLTLSANFILTDDRAPDPNRPTSALALTELWTALVVWANNGRSHWLQFKTTDYWYLLRYDTKIPALDCFKVVGRDEHRVKLLSVSQVSFKQTEVDGEAWSLWV